ncbi:3-beta hydroxysteroid dehydrogenase [Verrucomicrobia bacterium LW23]|nr:3-beta hydroxysteroid dehydrogenase [Verrucomicrobia bacterium LW23]
MTKVLVTGGGGFLGRAIVQRLVARGDSVRSLARADYPELTGWGVEVIRGDLEDTATVEKAAKGVDIIYHVAAKAGIWGSRASFYGPNVHGTDNILQACWKHGIGKLVYTSSPSVVFDGSDIEGADETLPYPKRFHAYYPETKALAEKTVLAANGSRLATVALRPHLIWGPGDNHLTPRILARGMSGSLRRVGRRPNLVDSVYVDNAVDAHLLAAEKLAIDSPVAGKAYFISNGEPRPLWDLVNAILAAGGVAPVTRTIPARVARAIGSTLEWTYKTLRITAEPRMTRFLAEELATAHWFNISAARRDLGYDPAVTITEGLDRLAQWLETDPYQLGLPASKTPARLPG